MTIGYSPADCTTGESRTEEQQFCVITSSRLPKAWYSKAHWVAYVSPRILDVSQKPWSRIQSHAGTDEAFLAALYARRVHAGGWPSEAGRASRGAFALLRAAGFTRWLRDYRAGVAGSNPDSRCKKDTKMWLFAPSNIRRKFVQVAESIWRPRRDLNPCYRRESGHPSRKLLKLDGMDSAQRPF